MGFRIDCPKFKAVAAGIVIMAMGLSLSDKTLAQSPQMVGAEASTPNSIPGGSVSTKPPTKKKKSKVNKKRKNKKVTKKKAKKRNIASLSGHTEVLVFSEDTRFEEQLLKAEDLTRGLASQESLARVIGVRREVGLRNNEEAPMNIILNGGSSQGIEQGQVLKVFRKIPVIDPYRENKQSEVEIEFANLRVVHTEKDVSIAKIENIQSLQKGLYVGTRSVLIGDFVR